MSFCHWVVATLFIPLGSLLAAEDPLFHEASITPEQLWLAVENRNPTLAAMQATIAAAQARTEQASALDDPMLMTRLAPASLGSGAGPAYTLELSQRLPWPGKRDAKRELAAREQRVAQADRATLRLQLAGLTMMAFADYWRVARTLQLNQQSRQLWQEIRSISEAQYVVGKAGKQDVLAAELALQNVERVQLQWQHQWRNSRAILNGLLNCEPMAPLPPPAEIVLPDRIPEWSRLQQLSLAHHPELASHESHIDAAEQEVRLAELNAYPDFELHAGYDRFWDDPGLRGNIALLVNLPFGGNRDAAKREAEAKVLSGRFMLADKRNQLLQALSTAHAAFAEMLGTQGLYRDQLLPLADENQASALQAYRAGTGDFLHVLEAQRSLLDTRQGLLDTQAELLRDWAALAQAAGGNEVLHEALGATP